MPSHPPEHGLKKRKRRNPFALILHKRHYRQRKVSTKAKRLRAREKEDKAMMKEGWGG